MRHGLTLTFLLIAALAWTACGGGSASGEAGPGGGGGTAPPSENAVPVASGPTGSAAQGAQCDFGGAERFTCAAGLVCCYPAEGEVAYGSCTQNCPGYD